MKRRAVVVGAGTMGCGLALLAARHGIETTLVGRRDAALGPARERMERGFDFLSQAGLIDNTTAAESRARLTITTDLEDAVSDAGLVLEAVTEDPDVKRAAYEAIGRAAPATALVASTTSGLDIFSLLPEFASPERLIIAHFWNPPYLVPLVEVVAGPRTAEANIHETEEILRSWERVPVRLSRYIPGFIGVRLNSAFYREAADLIARGITDARGIDTVMRESVALRFAVLDPMEIVDFGGLDTFGRVWANAFPDLAAGGLVPDFVERLVADGAVGVKAGRGLYDWAGRPSAELIGARDRQLARWLHDRHRYRLDAGLTADRPTEEQMNRRKIAGPQFGTRTGAFSNAYVVDLGSAEIIHTAGHLAIDGEGRLVGGSDTAKQAEYIYGLLESILKEAGASLDDVVKTTAYLTDMRDYPAVNEVRNRVFARREPASTIVEAPKLVHPLAKIEIELIAIRGK